MTLKVWQKWHNLVVGNVLAAAYWYRIIGLLYFTVADKWCFRGSVSSRADVGYSGGRGQRGRDKRCPDETPSWGSLESNCDWKAVIFLGLFCPRSPF